MTRTTPRIVSLRCALLLLCGLTIHASGAAQRRPAPRPSPTPTTTTNTATTNTQPADIDNADLAIIANVTARELRFEVVPNPTVEFPGQPKRETVWQAERQNLPTPVQPGVTYRDIGIRLVITSVFADIDRIVAEALGEVPMSDDSTPPPTNPPPPDNNNVPTVVAPTTPPANPTPQRTPTPAANHASPQRPRSVRRP